MCESLTVKERAALDEYTGPAFAGWNPLLRGVEAIESTIWDKVHLVISALGKVEKCKGSVSRALTFDDQESLTEFMQKFGDLMDYKKYMMKSLLNKLPTKAEGGEHEYVSQQFLSCKGAAMDIGAASFVASDNRKKGVLIKILCCGKHGGDLRQMYKGKDLGEAEVLFPPGVTFTVLAATEGMVLLAETGKARIPINESRKRL